MADLTYQVDLNTREAQRQIAALEAQLAQLSDPINVPINLGSTGQVDNLRRDLGAADDSVERLNRELNETDDSLRRVGTEANRAGTQVEQVGRRGTTAFAGLSRSVVGLVGAFGAIAAARGFLNFAGDAIDAASDLEESTSKAQVVFGEFFDDIQQFAGSAPQALGLANQQALEFTATFGNLFTALGLSQQAAAELSPEIVQLGADLASFNNIAVDEALTALRSGLVGEVEPLRRLGVAINAAAVEAKALELGLAGSTGEVSEAAKVQARYALILEQTTNAQGDFARTSDSIANRQKTLAAEFNNVQTAIGEALLPAFEVLLEIAPALIDAVENGLVPAFAGLVSSVENVDPAPFVDFISSLPVAFDTLATSTSAFGQAFGNAIQILTLNGGDIVGIGEQFRQLGDDIQTLQEAPIANEAVQNLIATLVAGREPTEALGSVLQALGDDVSGLTVDTFEDLANQLVTMSVAAGANLVDLADLADLIEEVGQDAGFSAAGVSILTDIIRDLVGASITADADVALLAFAINDTAEAAQAGIQPMTDFGQSLSNLIPQDFDFDAQIAAIQRGLQDLPGALDAAGAALRDEEGDIVEDFSDFLDNLDAEIQARAQFRRNIAILESLGLDNLAAVFTEAGLDAAAALADAVANPQEAARAEAALDDAAERQATEYVTAFGATVGQRLAELSPPEFEVIPVLGPLDSSSLDSSFLSINVGAGAPGFGVGEPRVVVYNQQTFTETPTPNTQTARAAQTVRNIVTRS